MILNLFGFVSKQLVAWLHKSLLQQYNSPFESEFSKQLSAHPFFIFSFEMRNYQYLKS